MTSMRRKYYDPNETIPMMSGLRPSDRMSIATVVLSMSLGAMVAFLMTRDDAEADQDPEYKKVLAAIEEQPAYDDVRSQMALSFHEVLTKADSLAEEIAQTQAVALQIPAKTSEPIPPEEPELVSQTESLRKPATEEARSHKPEQRTAGANAATHSPLKQSEPAVKQESQTKRLRGALDRVLGGAATQRNYVVQIAAYPDASQAKDLTKQIQKLGYTARIAPITNSKGVTMYRVQAIELTEGEAKAAKYDFDDRFHADSLIKQDVLR